MLFWNEAAVKDPYVVLGVARAASAEEIKQAYRALARELHPDVNQGNPRSEDRFKEVSAAYDFLSDADKRAQFDRGDIDATGAAARRRWGGRAGQAGAGAGAHARSSGFGFGEDVDDILSEMLRRKDKGRSGWAGGASSGFSSRTKAGADARHPLTLTFAEAATGCTKRIELVTGKSLDVRIPAGSAEGQSLRLKGQGHPGTVGGADGDAFVDIHVAPHPFFTRRELDVLIDIPISLQEAVLGGKVTVPTIDGRVSVTVQPGSNSGAVLRLKGKGIPGPQGVGDQLVTLAVVLPEGDADLKKFVEKWGPRHGYDPRAKAGL